MNVSKLNRTIFIRDNIEVLRCLKDKCIDLIYLDPPFSTNSGFNVPIGSTPIGVDFKDIWTNLDTKKSWWGELSEKHPALYEIIHGIGCVRGVNDKAYLIFMAMRILELHRVLKGTGSIFLHCDQTMSHSLKLVMDSIFGKKNFRNEIICCYHGPGFQNMKQFNKKHDTIFWYNKDSDWVFNCEQIKVKYKDSNQILRRAISPTGGLTKSEVINQKEQGKIPEDWWKMRTVASISKEYLGYITQKPLALLDRIIKASSNEGDMVLDPFCGCATTCVAAERLKREWIGIDVSSKAGEMIASRIKSEFDQGGAGKKMIHTFIRKDLPIKSVSKPSKNIKNTLYGKQEGRCNGCKIHFLFRNLQKDHIVPLSKNGQDTDTNLQLLCSRCNSVKGDRPMAYLKEQLSKDNKKDQIE